MQFQECQMTWISWRSRLFSFPRAWRLMMMMISTLAIFPSYCFYLLFLFTSIAAVLQNSANPFHPYFPHPFHPYFPLGRSKWSQQYQKSSSLCHPFMKKEPSLSLVTKNWIWWTENNCEITLEPSFWVEMSLKWNISVSPNDGSC